MASAKFPLFERECMNDSAKCAQSRLRSTAIDDLRGQDRTRWPNITAARTLSCDKMAALTAIVGDLLPTDEGSLVVFGSLARSEFTVESDLDWTIMIDGRADSSHLKIVHALKSRLKDRGFKLPG